MIAQGTIVDAIKLAMVDLASKLADIGQIIANWHDALLLEVQDGYASEATALLKTTMEQALGGLIPGTPVVVDCKCAKSLAKAPPNECR